MKTRAQSTINKLPENQRADVERWLFEEHISYKAACKRLLENWNVRLAPSSLCEWYKRASQERMLARIVSNSGASATDKIKHEAATRCFERFSMIKLIMEHQANAPGEAIRNIEFSLFHAPEDIVREAQTLTHSGDFPAAKNGGLHGHFIGS